MKKTIFLILFSAIVLLFTACGNAQGDLSISPEVTEYDPSLSSAPGIALTAVFTRDLKNSDLKFHWIAEEGTFIMWHNEGNGRLQDLGSDMMTNVHKIYWTVRNGDIEDKTFSVYLSVENIYTSEVLAETSIKIQNAGGTFIVVD